MHPVQFIQTVMRLSEEAKTVLSQAFKKADLSRGHVLQQQGMMCRHLYFIESGLLRVFYYNSLGKDITYRFVEENHFYSIIDSYFNQKPSFYTVELLEDSVLYSVPYAEFEKYLHAYPELERMSSYVLRHFLIESNERIIAFQFQSAQERYNALIENHPSLIRRVSLGHIASYLGITQETLSRIRK